MKKIILALLAILPFSLYAQKEVKLNLGSGIFYFVGEPTEEKPSIIIDENEFYYLGFEPYSNIPSISFNLSSGFQKVDSTQFIFGSNIGFDYFNNSIPVDKFEIDSYSNFKIIGQGKIYSKIYEISFSPFIGKRFELRNLKIDIIGCVEFAFPFSAADYIEVFKDEGNSDLLQYKRKLHAEVFDFRPNFKLACSYKNIGIFGQYLRGMKNYASDEYYGVVFSRLYRFGITYNLYKS